VCLIAFAIGTSPEWPLVIASNRDEFLARPTAPLSRWAAPGGTEIYSGRDLLDGGTWLGLTPQGRVGMLTNVRRGQPGRGRRSRGELVLKWLTSGVNSTAFMEDIRGEDYGGFNLVVGQVGTAEWHWLSNRSVDGTTDGAISAQQLPPGLYGLSNGLLDAPWPKTVKLKQALQGAMAAHRQAPLGTDTRHDLRARLMTALGDRERAPEESLPRTGVPPEWEQALSSPFVDDPDKGYGTLCSTIVLVRSGLASMTELSHREVPGRLRSLEFSLV
jgi:uncharacterized protein with NRDE domain